MDSSMLHYYVAQVHAQELIDQAASGRRVAEARRARRQRQPRRRWTFGRYSVPKMRSPASPKPGRM